MLAAVGTLAFAALLAWSMPDGPGLSPDSLKYLLLADSLAERRGFALLGVPASHFPPGYPALLALAGATDPASLGRAALLQSVLGLLVAGLLARTAAAAAGAGWAAPLATL